MPRTNQHYLTEIWKDSCGGQYVAVHALAEWMVGMTQRYLGRTVPVAGVAGDGGWSGIICLRDVMHNCKFDRWGGGGWC